MVTNTATPDKTVFNAIADPTRRAILDLLRDREMAAGDIAGHFPVSRPAIAKHVRILKKTGLLKERREAQRRIYTIDPTGLRAVDRWLAPYRLFWGARMGALKGFVENRMKDS